MLPWHKSQPCRQLTPVFKDFYIANRRRQRGCSKHTHTRYGQQALAIFVLFANVVQFFLYAFDTLIKMFNFFIKLKQQFSIREYSCSQTTLEQIFNTFAKENEIKLMMRRKSTKKSTLVLANK